jgi:hypothetical protein
MNNLLDNLPEDCQRLIWMRVFDGCLTDINSKRQQCDIFSRLKNKTAQDLRNAIDEYQQLTQSLFKVYTLGDDVAEWNAMMELLSKGYQARVGPFETQLKEATQFLDDLRYV